MYLNISKTAQTSSSSLGVISGPIVTDRTCTLAFSTALVPRLVRFILENVAIGRGDTVGCVDYPGLRHDFSLTARNH